MNPLFLTALIVGSIATYLDMKIYFYLVLIMFSVGYGLFYIRNNPKKTYLFIGVSLFIIMSLYVIEYLSIDKIKLYDSFLITIAIYILGITISKRFHELGYVAITSVIVVLIMLFVPNISIGDVINERMLESGKKLNVEPTTIEKLKEGYKLLMSGFDIEKYTQNQLSENDENNEEAKKKMKDEIYKKETDIIKLSSLPEKLYVPENSRNSFSLSVYNEHETYILRNVVVGFDVGHEGRKYGFKVNGNSCINEYLCFYEFNEIPPKDYELTSFDIMAPSCRKDIKGYYFVKYPFTTIAEKSINIGNEEFDKTKSSDGVLSLAINLLPEKITYDGEGDIKFIITLYAFSDSKVFDKTKTYYESMFLSLPKEVNLEFDKTYCPYIIYKREEDKIIYKFDVRDEIRCFDDKNIGFIRCNAVVYKEDAEKFVNGYRTFKAYIPHVTYGLIDYDVSSEGSSECKSSLKEDFSLSKIIRDNINKEYLVSLEGEYEGDIMMLINDIYDFCSSIYEGSLKDGKCVYLKIKNFKGNLDSTNETDNGVYEENQNLGISLEKLFNNLEISYMKEIDEKKIINNYDGEGDLIIKVEYQFKCRKRTILITLEG